MWFTEAAVPPMLLFGVLGVLLLAAWYPQRRGLFLVGAGCAFAAAAATFFIERWVVTDSEQVELRVFELADACQRGDAPAALEFVSAQAPALKTELAAGLALVKLEPDLDVKDLSVRLTAANSRATAQFRANGTGELRGVGAVRHFATRWELTWQKEGADWKIIRVQRLHPFRDEPLDVLDKSSP